VTKSWKKWEIGPTFIDKSGKSVVKCYLAMLVFFMVKTVKYLPDTLNRIMGNYTMLRVFMEQLLRTAFLMRRG